MLHNQKPEILHHDDLPALLNAAALIGLFEQASSDWHQSSPAITDTIPLQLHRANFDLWHQEDRARNPQSTDAEIAAVKHSIDRINQRRNDLVEQFDRDLLASLSTHNLPDTAAPLHSETPGLILDRLSILALKIFHTREETTRPATTQAHRDLNHARLKTLLEQNADLTACLQALWDDILHRRRSFKLYRQLKMYNDPTLNPVLYKHAEG